MKGPNLTQFDVVQQQAEVVLSCYRKRFGLPNVVPAPVEIIAKELFGLDILDLKMERYGKRAKGGLSVGASAIVKDPTLNWRQFRFLVAHEIGHLVLHQKKVIEIDLEGERKEYRLEWPLESETCKGQKVREKTAETEANRFAAALLLPSQPLHEAMKRYRVIDAQAISELKEEFLVSVDVLLARIRDLRYHLCWNGPSLDLHALDDLEENIQYHRSYRFHNSTQRPSRFSKHPASTSRWEISPSLSLLTHKTTIPQKRFPISIRLDYFSQGNFKRKNRKHPVVIELAGTPNGGKDITLLALQDYLTDYCGLKVRFIDEGIKSCHIDKAFDIDRLYKTIALAVLQLYEAKYENPGDYDVVLINRGIFDRLAFLSAMLALGKISAEQERIHREYLLSYADLQEYTAILLISPSESMQREWISKRKIVQVLAEESGMERSLKEQTLHKEEILANFNTSYLTTYRNYFHHFRGQAYLLDFRDQGNIDAKMIVQVMLEIINPGEKMQLPLPSLVAEVYRQESLEKKLAKVGSKRTTPKKKNIKNHTFTLPGLDEIYFKHPICELQSAA